MLLQLSVYVLLSITYGVDKSMFLKSVFLFFWLQIVVHDFMWCSLQFYKRHLILNRENHIRTKSIADKKAHTNIYIICLSKCIIAFYLLKHKYNS